MQAVVHQPNLVLLPADTRSYVWICFSPFHISFFH